MCLAKREEHAWNAAQIWGNFRIMRLDKIRKLLPLFVPGGSGIRIAATVKALFEHAVIFKFIYFFQKFRRSGARLRIRVRSWRNLRRCE